MVKRSRITSYLGIISLGLAIIPGVLVYFLEPDYSEPIILLPGIFISFLIFPSIVCSYFELQTSKRNWRAYPFHERESVGRGLSLFYGLGSLILGIVMPFVSLVTSELIILIKLGLIYISWIISGILGIVGAIVYRDAPQNLSSDEKLKRRKIGFSTVMICSILIVTTILFLNTSAPYYRTLNVHQDAYVYEYHPNTNYGEDDLIYVGNYEFGKAEAYYHFDISNFADGWKEAKLELKFDFASYPVNIGVCIIYDSWDELSITWNNKPNRTTQFGHILCDGFNFHALVKPKHFKNNELTICLYGIGGGSDGYLSGTSKEGASNDNGSPYVHLEYKGIDPNYFIFYIIAYILIFAVTVLYLKYQGKFSYPRTLPRTTIPIERLREQRLNELLLRRRRRTTPINRPVRGVPLHPSEFYKTREIFKINELVDL